MENDVEEVSRLLLMNDYYRILLELGRWRVISMSSLYEQAVGNTGYQVFTKKIRKLEKAGLIKSILDLNRKKFLVLSKIGEGYFPEARSVSEIDDTLLHDLITTNVLTSLGRSNCFNHCGIPVFEEFEEIFPDGIIYGVKNKINYTLAVEIELTQKSKRRVIDKFNKYERSKYHDYVLYVFKKTSVIDSYLKVLESMNSEVQNKIILCLDENLSVERFDFMDSKIWFEGIYKTFEEIFYSKVSV